MKNIVFSLLVGLALSGCGAINAADKMPAKMDLTNEQVKETNKKMDETKDAVKQTNDKMDTMIDQVQRTNDAMGTMIDEVRKTNQGMDQMIDEVRKTNEGIEKTNAAVHNQALAVALAEMLKPENTRTVFPPLGMLPAGQVFAREATSDEIVQLVYVYLQDIDTVMPDDSNRNPDGSWKPKVIKKYDHEKLVKFMAAMLIAGMAPQTTIDQMVKSEIDDGGRFEATAYQVLMMRYTFVHDFMLQGSLFASPLSNPGKIDTAVEYATYCSAISDLPYANQISVKTNGMLNPEDNINLVLNPESTTEVWQWIDRAFDNDLDAKYKDPKNPSYSHLQKVRAEVKRHTGDHESTEPVAPIMISRLK